MLRVGDAAPPTGSAAFDSVSTSSVRGSVTRPNVWASIKVTPLTGPSRAEYIVARVRASVMAPMPGRTAW